MKEVFEKIKERLEKEVIALEDNYGDLVECIPSKVVFEIINQVAEEFAKDTKVGSNADRIRSMSFKELKEFLYDFAERYSFSTEDEVEEWLQSEAEW